MTTQLKYLCFLSDKGTGDPMLFRSLLLTFSILVTSCGHNKWWGENEQERKLASGGLKQLLREDDLNHEQKTMEKLTSLHYYMMIAQKNLKDFDDFLELESLPYQNLMASKIQIDEIEDSLRAEYQLILKSKKQEKHERFQSYLIKFAGLSKNHQISVENLLESLGLSDLIPPINHSSSQKELIDHYKSLQTISEFQIYEKNIEHLSHMIDFKFESGEKSFSPSINKMGNINGSEFPQKLWSLTFNDGPSSSTLPIIDLLNMQGFKATFFPLGQNFHNNTKQTTAFFASSMEIGAHADTNSNLTKVGNLTLDKHISGAFQKLSQHQKHKTNLYRLPYGAGQNSTHIRERIAQNEAIHVFWTVDALDWMPQNPEKIVARTLKLMKKSPKDSGIILFHDTHNRTLVSLPEVLNYLKKDGRKVCTVGAALQIMNQGGPITCL